MGLELTTLRSRATRFTESARHPNDPYFEMMFRELF